MHVVWLLLFGCMCLCASCQFVCMCICVDACCIVWVLGVCLFVGKVHKSDVCCLKFYLCFYVLQLLINLLLNLTIVFSINCCYHNTYNFTDNIKVSAKVLRKCFVSSLILLWQPKSAQSALSSTVFKIQAFLCFAKN